MKIQQLRGTPDDGDDKLPTRTNNDQGDHFELLGVRISAVDLRSASARIARWISQRRKMYVCVAPVSTVIECQDDERYRRIVNAAGMVTPDGMPVVWFGRWKVGNKVQRTYGPDLMEYICAGSIREGFKHYFYGGSSLTNRLLVEKLRNRYPGIKIVGHYAPAVLEVGQKESDDVIASINASGADVLWIGLGSPKQDFWMATHREQINVPVMIGAGAAFDFLAGTKPQAPPWMRNSGLEWLFRLGTEPSRLWRRYIFGNTRFLILFCLRELFLMKERRAVRK